MNKNRKVYFNGQFVDEKKLEFQSMTRLLCLVMVFEMTRSFNKNNLN